MKNLLMTLSDLGAIAMYVWLPGLIAAAMYLQAVGCSEILCV